MQNGGGARDSPLHRDEEASALGASRPAGGAVPVGNVEASDGAWGVSCAPPAGLAAPSLDWAAEAGCWCSGALSLFMMVVTRTAF